jgi:lipopolysaccharide biosynthesis glycosyltransferase
MLSPDADVLVFFSGDPADLKPWPLPANVHVLVNAVDLSIFATLNHNASLPLSSYVRLAAPLLVPHRCKHLIYVDCDMAFADDFAEIWRINTCSHVICAVSDFIVAGQSDNFTGQPHTYAEMIGLRSPRYANAGLLLVNPQMYRESGILDRLAEAHAALNPGYLLADQDILNWILAGDFGELSPRWNMFMPYAGSALPEVFPLSVVHYAGQPKPWQNLWLDHDPIHRARCKAAFASIGEKLDVRPPFRVALRALRLDLKHRLGLSPGKFQRMKSKLMSVGGEFDRHCRRLAASTDCLDIAQRVTVPRFDEAQVRPWYQQVAIRNGKPAFLGPAGRRS